MKTVTERVKKLAGTFRKLWIPDFSHKYSGVLERNPKEEDYQTHTITYREFINIWVFLF